MARSIYCSACKKEKEPSCLNESRCKACKSYFAKLLRQKKRVLVGKEPDRPERKAKCDACIEKQANGVSIAGRCNKCVTISNNEKRHEERRKQGLPEIAVRDVSFCHVCNIPKIDGRCAPCRKRMAAERKAKKREESGKRPWGSGRPLTCYKCNKVKENPETAHCNACTSEYGKKRWAEVIAPRIKSQTTVVMPSRTGLCVCGNERAPYHKSYCKPCLARLARERRVRQNEGKIQPVKVPLTPEQKRIKRHARDLVNSEIRKGYLIPQPCEACGTSISIEAHHDDYSKPLHVRWLCVVHHREHHRNNP